ncbi:MAG: 50S ribosomal protein L10 [Candidatus Dormibacteraeota bacterium]|nr:50S ribosomal protein L10 [Candidatus Dormibacteraeota bacterium]
MAPKAKKIEQVQELTEKLQTARAAVITHYRGLTVAQLHDLRNRLRAQNVEYRVVKNTLARRAAQGSGHGSAELEQMLIGPVAIAFGFGELSAPAKLLAEYTRQTRLPLEVIGGLVEGRLMAAEQVRQTADLPSREVLLAQLLGTLQSPIAQLVGTMQAPVQTLLGLLEAYRTKLDGEAATAA